MKTHSLPQLLSLAMALAWIALVLAIDAAILKAVGAISNWMAD